jgi:ubiquitin-activating enzyme E1
LFSLQPDAEQFLQLAKEVNASSPAKVDELSDDLMREFAYSAMGDLCPIQAFIGGISAQEVMKVDYFVIE